MKIKTHIGSALVAGLFLMVPLLESCRTELCYNHFPVAQISLSWEHEWERDYGMDHFSTWDKSRYGIAYEDLRPETPEWVSLVRYTEDGDITSEKFFPAGGGELILDTESDKSFLLYNGDTQYIVLSDIASLPDARATATTRTRSSLSYIAEMHPGVRSMNPPDVLYSAFVCPPPEVAVHEKKEVPVKMQPLVYTYLVQYEFEEGVEHISLARGALAGMAESVYLRDGRTSDESAIILYDCDVKNYGCEAKVCSFGVPGFPDKYYGRTAQAAPEKYTLNLEVLLKNNKIVEFNVDISDQLRNQPRGGVIKVGGLKITEQEAQQPPQESGFDVDLNDWTHGIDVDLPVGSS